MHSSDELPLYCPQCGERIVINWGASTLSVRQAVRLQLVRNGVFFECTNCGNQWVIRNVSPSHHDAAVTLEEGAAGKTQR
jgi:predicted RNA-binding Zn-ribbon protein involved in translation (DUF1610 family)